MPAKAAKNATTRKTSTPPVAKRVEEALAWLESHKSKTVRDGMARYAIPSEHALGVAMRDIKSLGKTLGRDQPLARALWATGAYEARMLASFVGDPEQLTAKEMDRWCRDFDNWAFCDALAFNLFDRSPHAWNKVAEWSTRKPEFEKRAAFALLWSLALHDKRSGNEPFLHALTLIESASADDRNFVKKAVAMSLRAIGRRNPTLRAAATNVAQRLTASDNATSRWIARDALRDLTRGG